MSPRTTPRPAVPTLPPRAAGHSGAPGGRRPPVPSGPLPTVMHVDMDAFYASVELRRRPDLGDRPLIVGATGPRGVVLSANYPARARGVHAAQPVSRARRLCPDALVVAPDPEEYATVSAGVMELLHALCARVEPLPPDEAFLDLRGLPGVGGRADLLAFGELVRARIADEQGIPASVGIAASKLVAKTAASRAKPDGLLLVEPAETVAFLHPLPAAALLGVGPRTEELLARYGLHTVGEIAHTPLGTLRRILGATAADRLHEAAWGRDDRPVVPERRERSVGGEHTYPRDVDDPEVIRRTLLALAQRTAATLRTHEARGRTVVLKIRFADFTTITRSRTLPRPTDLAHELYAQAVALFAGLGLQRARIRLTGLRVEGLVHGEQPEQLPIDGLDGGRAGSPDTRWRQVERAIDRAAERFGRDAVRPASLLRRPPG
ncbi:DNA polymerase IV [Allostreptomyces psammosilenae]|uniref:DNA polymerase IV n=1 Tax=Allostreptomyces psammosilenae TaxID=1892865 RepID=A0A852ZZ33_9ACTN|nr:DNA polymerase IV [Allostreptomyces psammosilenae]NYI07087.1 DNA polymerase-4 [Allostreptomyces psammosilenae]